ncbi:MAG: DciA family protein [Rhizomicrobium sp.]
MTRAPKQPDSAETWPPPRRARAAAVGTDAAQLARAAFGRAGFAEPTLVLRWREIAGRDVARIARPLRLSQGASGGVLTLRADPAAALFLQHESRALCARINAYLGRPAVERLKFVPGEIAPEPERPKRTYPQNPSPRDPARDFAGPDRLKDALLALARARNAK